MVELTREGIEFLKSSESLELTRPMTAPATRDKHRSGEIECDEALFERLRGLRKQLADERGVPPYIVFSDVALRQMARHYPQNEADFGKINGVGEKKLAEFGETFMEAVAEHLESYPLHNFHG